MSRWITHQGQQCLKPPNQPLLVLIGAFLQGIPFPLECFIETGAFSLWEKLFTGSPSRQSTIFSLFKNFFQPHCYWLWSTWAYSSLRHCFYFCVLLSWSSVWIIPLFLLLRKYCIFSWFFQNIWLSQASLQCLSCPFACTIWHFWIKMLKYSWDIKWVFFYRKMHKCKRITKHNLAGYHSVNQGSW